MYFYENIVSAVCLRLCYIANNAFKVAPQNFMGYNI